MLSDRFWQNRLGGDPQIVGRNILLNNQPYTVVGIMPKGFESNPPVDLWLPLQADPASTNQGHYLAAAARLKPDVSIEQARGAMKVLGERFRAQNPKWMDPTESVAVVPMKDSMVEDVRLALLILLGAVGFVLLIACANVANLLLARAAVRQKELAIRAAIGASRWRVVRQLLTESVILAGAGAVLGFAIGAAGVRALLMVAPGNIPRLTEADGLHRRCPLLDWRVAGFTIGVAALTGDPLRPVSGALFSNPDLASTLKEGGRTGGGTLGRRSRSFLVVAEVALALVLVTGATLLIRTFSGLRSVDPGLNPHNVLVLETSLAGGSLRLHRQGGPVRPPGDAARGGAPRRAIGRVRHHAAAEWQRCRSAVQHRRTSRPQRRIRWRRAMALGLRALLPGVADSAAARTRFHRIGLRRRAARW